MKAHNDNVPATSSAAPSPISTASDWQVLCMDAAFEPVTCAGFEHRRSYLYPKLQALGVNLVFCSGPAATRAIVAPHASAQAVRYLTGEGHGTFRTYEGQNYDPIFDVGQLHYDEVHGKVVHLLACETAKELGQKMVANGCRAFFGYDIDFSFHHEFTDQCLQCDSEIDLAFAEGLTADQVFERAQSLFKETIAQLRSTGGAEANLAAAMLETNLAHLRCPTSGGPQWGQRNASLP